MAPFSELEMSRRLARTRAISREAGLDGVLMTSYPGIFYLAGTPIFQYGRHAAYVLPVDESDFLIAAMLERGHVKNQSRVEEVRYYADHSVDGAYANFTTPLESLTVLLRDALAQRGMQKARLGFEENVMPVSDFQAITSALPDLTLVPFARELDRQRLALSEEELALVRAGDRISGFGQKALIEAASVGRTSRELHDLCHATMTEAVCAIAPDKPYVLHHQEGLDDIGRLSGHSEWQTWDPSRVVAPGDFLGSIFGCHLWGYWGCVERTITVGMPTGSLLHGYETMIAAHEAALDAIRPGITFGRLDRIVKDVIEKRGHSTTPYGSGMGRGLTSWENNSRISQMDIRLYSDITIEVGMAISVEPMLGTDEMPFRHCTTAIVTEAGCEIDSDIPYGLVVV